MLALLLVVTKLDVPVTANRPEFEMASPLLTERFAAAVTVPRFRADTTPETAMSPVVDSRLRAPT